jgi:membrane protein insertase Oxa1/YidC/SpoIIIJ
MRSKGIKMGRQAVVMLANAGVFLTNFMAIKKMVDVKYPGFETGGMLWFPNLLAVDPYMGLPAISAVTSFVVLKVGIDFGASSDQMSPVMKIGMQYALPVIVFASGWWFSSVSYFTFSIQIQRLGHLYSLGNKQHHFVVLLWSIQVESCS